MRKKSAATASSALVWRNAARPSPPALIFLPGRLLAVDELGALHQRQVAGFLARYPVGVLLALQRGRVERALLHQLLPLRRLLHLLEKIGVVGHLVLAYAAGHEDAAQHQVIDVQALLLAGRDVGPGLLVGDLFLVRHALRV